MATQGTGLLALNHTYTILLLSLVQIVTCRYLSSLCDFILKQQIEYCNRTNGVTCHNTMEYIFFGYFKPLLNSRDDRKEGRERCNKGPWPDVSDPGLPLKT